MMIVVLGALNYLIRISLVIVCFLIWGVFCPVIVIVIEWLVCCGNVLVVIEFTTLSRCIVKIRVTMILMSLRRKLAV